MWLWRRGITDHITHVAAEIADGLTQRHDAARNERRDVGARLNNEMTILQGGRVMVARIATGATASRLRTGWPMGFPRWTAPLIASLTAGEHRLTVRRVDGR
jgi:hypothetical protein